MLILVPKMRVHLNSAPVFTPDNLTFENSLTTYDNGMYVYLSHKPMGPIYRQPTYTRLL